ncbi:MAG: sulfur carrier protein ThiS adenylyltransferase ThiF [Candidatus Cloacimonetes bacterium]|nr:sulfur carrier protein ThiS adenylyltransferase ThiF [Candidatus Cloacimonadota bacterium]
MNIEDLFLRNVPKMREKLKANKVGIAGCGGLGTNIAVSLVRAGIGEILLADFDKVELSNLNRQYFFLDDIGKMKTEALKEIIQRINPEVKITTINEELTPQNVVEIFSDIDVMVEAFDLADRKYWLIDSWSRHHKEIPLVCGSGVAGYGKSNELKMVRIGNLYVCGDQRSDMKDGLCSARVALVANMQANTVIEIIMQKEFK